VCIEAVEALDMDRLERALNHAATELSRLHLLENVVAPLMTRIGERWSEGSLRILNEHMASTVIHSFLWDLLRGSGGNGTRPPIVIATPSKQWCTLGALVAAVFAGDIGWHPYFFGPNLPAEEISAAARMVRARVVALSITFGAEPVHLGRELKRLHLALDPSVRLLIGGRATKTVRSTIEDIGALHVDSLSMFKSALEGPAAK
jgi:methanogenic corrinoid protein MtbC1